MIDNRMTQSNNLQNETDLQATPGYLAIRNLLGIDNPTSNPLNNLFQAIKHVD